MTRKGLLIDYEYCSGCHACEVACKQELNLPRGQRGIQVVEIGPMMMQGKLNLYYVPFPTPDCDLCLPRMAANGGMPSCVKHCPAGAMRYGDVGDLTRYLEGKPQTVLWAPK